MSSTAFPAFVKGHGTGNDFLVYADPEGHHPLTAEQVQEVTARGTGVGADGVLRAIAVDAAVRTGLTEHQRTGEATWFMDHRNADGAPAQMCGNGIRVFAAFLIAEGLVDLGDGHVLPVATRAGQVMVRREGSEFSVELGPWSAPGGTEALRAGSDVQVQIAGMPAPRPGLRLALPNPHTVIALTDQAELEQANLSVPPSVDPAPPEGTNVELVVPLGEQDQDIVDEAGEVIGTESVGVAKMRVFERGVGETLSCGTGAVAAALAVRTWFGAGAPATWYVLVPGGRLRVTVFDDHYVELTGPAQLVARVQPF
ncbi:MAG TPA: diaminopimelate epimerase [Beutenbergiaceae bacterium]|nr:diaminopimelate epimerase [Beutenbergiaceae bacterium]